MSKLKEILSRTEKVGDCLLWTGSRRKTGYGQISIKGKTQRTHRVVFELAFGKIPPSMCVCHRCDNPPCINPNHLFLDTHAGNMLDCKKKGRRPSGNMAPTAKLNSAQVQQIRRDYVPWVVSLRFLAKKYGVDQRTIRAILCGVTWKGSTA